jgi:hypothetical protein
MANTYLTRTPSSAGNRRTFTISVWFKRTGLDQSNYIFDCDGGSAQSENVLGLYEDRLGFSVWNSSTSSSAVDIRVARKLRDTNAWYHVVCAVDTTQATASNRVKIYLNGELQTSLTSTTYPSQNYETAINSAIAHDIGRWSDGAGRYFNGLMSHFHFIDGTAYDADTFGEEDSTTGEWKIKTSPSVTYGTNGYALFTNDATGTDTSGNSNDFTVSGGTLTATQDSPSNVFATMNDLDNYYFGGTFSNGNNTVASVSSVESYWTSSLGASSGKYYWEVKISASGSDREFIGIADKVSEVTSFSAYSGNNKMRSYYGHSGSSVIGSTGSSFGATFGTGDIIGVAMDLDNHKIYYSKNGAWQGSGNPTTGSNGLDIDTSPASGFYYAQGGNIHDTASTFQTNFGNGYFGTTEVSSAGTNASGIGIFEYDVPTGFTALSTKGLNL